MAKDRFIDRPHGNLRMRKKEELESLASDYELWKAVWKISLSLAAVKAFARATKDNSFGRGLDGHEWYRRILAEELNEAGDIFVDLIAQDYKYIIDIINKSNNIFPHFNRINSPIVFFIDNVDEFFNPFLENRSVRPRNSSTLYRTRNNDLWILPQIALATVAYELENANRHIKIFCTMRHEAFLRMSDIEIHHYPISGRCIRIEYTRQDLEKIFLKNIDVTSKADLVDPKNNDVMARFVGSENKNINHRFVPKAEPIFDYFLRHTLYRPRDLMHIGGHIARINPSYRSSDAIRTAVDHATKDIVDSIFTEMSPFFATPERDILLKHIESNVLSLEQLQEIRQTYVHELGARGLTENGSEISYPFRVLHKLGLLGTVRLELNNKHRWRQWFLQPTEIQLENETQLPHSECYLIHPALDQYVYEKSSGKIVRGFHSKNIVGNQLEWFDPITYSFVMKGDFVGYSNVMSEEIYQIIVQKLFEWARQVCRDLAYVEFSGGDSILMIDASPQKVVRAAKDLLKRALSFEERPMKMRFGGAAGPIVYERTRRFHDGRWERIVVPRGLALRTSARLEPHAPPGSALVEGVFHDFGASREADPNALGSAVSVEGLPADLMIPASCTDLPSLKYVSDSEKFIVQKNNLDPPYITKLYRIKLDRST